MDLISGTIRMTNRFAFLSLIIISNLFNNAAYGQVAVAIDGTNNGSTQTGCSFTVTDSNPSGSYNSNEDYVVTFCSGTTQPLELAFTSFSMENGYDFVYVYDGNSTASTQFLLSPFSGTTIPSTIFSTGTCITIRVTTDGSVIKPGFEATIICGCSASTPAITGTTVSQMGGSSNNFVNGDLEDTPANSAAATGWQHVFYGDPVSQSTWGSGSTIDLHDAWSTISSGYPHSGSTYQSGLHHAMTGGSTWHEGIKQTVSAFTVGATYEISFWQAVVKQFNALENTGAWAVYLDNTLVGTSPSSTSTLAHTDENLIWEQRTISFTATATSHVIKFMPQDGDGNIIEPNGLRMGIDLIEFLSDTCAVSASYSVTFEGTGGSPAYTYDIGVGPQSSGTFTGLSTGNYTCTVTDNCGSTFVQSYTVTDPNCVVLPVELSSFEIQCKDRLTELKWQTASEINNDFFTIERGRDAVHFEPVALVNGNGNSSQIINYTWTDDNPFNGTAYYRLKQTDFDGAFEYSKIIAVDCNKTTVFSIYPNPIENVFLLNSTYAGSISLIDQAGRVVLERRIIAGKNIIQSDQIASGSYIAFITLKNGTRGEVIKVIKF